MPPPLPSAVLKHALLPFLSFCELVDVRCVSRCWRRCAEALAIARASRQLGSQAIASASDGADGSTADEKENDALAGAEHGDNLPVPAAGVSPAVAFSPSDVVWLRQRLAWLSGRRYNVLRAERGEGGGDFALLCDFPDAEMFGLDFKDGHELGQLCGWGGAWLYSVLPFTRVFARALQKVKGGGIDALKERWRLRAERFREEHDKEREMRLRTRRQLRAALECVCVDLDSLHSNADEEWWDAGDFSFGQGWWYGRPGPIQWMCRSRRPVCERFVRVHTTLVALGMDVHGCQCSDDCVRCCLS